jgi:hypothetical protein
MRLSCLKALLPVVALTTACHEATAPPQAISRLYILESIDGRPLPTITSAGAGDTTTMLWATFTLDPVGNAVEVDHRRHVYLTNPAEETTFAAHYEYRTTGDSVTVGSFMPCPDLCPSNRVGILSDSMLALTVGYNPYPINPTVYLYRLIKSY